MFKIDTNKIEPISNKIIYISETTVCFYFLISGGRYSKSSPKSSKSTKKISLMLSIPQLFKLEYKSESVEAVLEETIEENTETTETKQNVNDKKDDGSSKSMQSKSNK